MTDGAREAAAGIRPASTDAVLRLQGVRKSFGATPVLRGIDLEVREHEVVALIGASGSGKSTLLRCVTLLEGLDDGQIFLRGDDISDPRVDADRVRARMGVVFQQFNLFPHIRVLDNVTLAARRVLREPRASAEARALELLDRVGLADKARVRSSRATAAPERRAAAPRLAPPRAAAPAAGRRPARHRQLPRRCRFAHRVPVQSDTSCANRLPLEQVGRSSRSSPDPRYPLPPQRGSVILLARSN